MAIPDPVAESLTLSCSRDGAYRIDAAAGEPAKTVSFVIEADTLSRSKPLLEHSVVSEPDGTLKPFYLPLNKGQNRIRVSGAKIKSVTFAEPSAKAARLPNQLLVPVTSYCNFRCVMCPHGLPEGVKGKAHYPDDLADLLIEELNASRQTADVALTGLGESFMAPVFTRIVNSVTNDLARFNFTTNGSMLTQDRIHWILDSQIRRVNISLDAATPETFFKIRRADWHAVLRNVERLAEMAKHFRPHDLCIELNMTLMKENLSELDDFVRLAARLGVAAYVNQLNDYPMNVGWVVQHDGFTFDYQQQILHHHSGVSDRVAHAARLAYDLKVPFTADSPLRPVLDISQNGEGTIAGAANDDGPPIRQCPSPWASDMEGAAVIHADGSVCMCCLQAPVGKMGATESLISIWNGPIANLVREQMLAGRIPIQCAGANCRYVAEQRAFDSRLRPKQAPASAVAASPIPIVSNRPGSVEHLLPPDSDNDRFSRAVSPSLRQQWIRDGYVILPGIYGSEALDKYKATVARERHSLPEDKDEFGYGDRLGQLHQKYPDLLELATDTRVLSFLQYAFGDEPVVFSSLNFERGSEQGSHIDAIFFYPQPAYTMAGCWIALEDVHPDSGPLFCIPGSHRWSLSNGEDVVAGRPELAAKREAVRSHPGCVQEPEVLGELGDMWASDLAAKQAAEGTDSVKLLAKAGDVVIWHSLLAHGGSRRTDRSLSRRTAVFHYIGAKTALYTYGQFFLKNRSELPDDAPQPMNLTNYQNIRYMRYGFYASQQGGSQQIHRL